MMPVWAWKLIGAAVLALAIFGAGMKTMSMLDAGKLAKETAIITAQAAAVRQVTALTNLITKSDSAAETVAQGQITAQAQVITKEITRYVSNKPSPAVGCITVGMLRVHDAAVTGRDPGDILPPAGQSDDACAPVAPSDFMAAVADNYAAARANAEQLNSLENDIRARESAVAAADNPR